MRILRRYVARASDEQGQAGRGVGFNILIEMVKKDTKNGKIKDWGVKVGELRGGGIAEGTLEEVRQVMYQYIPICKIELHQLVSVEQAEAVLNAANG